MMLSISIDGGGLPAVQRYMAKNGFTMPALVDAKMETARQFGARGVPTTFIVDRLGLIVASGYGSVDFDAPAFRTYLQALALQRHFHRNVRDAIGVFFIGCMPYKESRDVSRLSYPTEPRCPTQL
jgi:hypothetical protein